VTSDSDKKQATPAPGSVWTTAKKELRGYFNSAVAVIFLAAFLAVAMYTFFWREKFFARGVADLRPLFEWLPKLLIILVSALAMRLWADERRGGTLEILLTLPVPRYKLVLGKFVAGLLLIAVALGTTLGLPLTISHMGHLDLGPVIGGYVGAMLLSAAYLAIGMCVSAATDNQIVAFIGTAILCGVAYAIGDLGGDLGRLLGTGARFESIARGVLDLRDLAYYGGIVAIGIALNVVLLQRLTWAKGVRGRARRRGTVLAVALVALNAIALDIWLAPVQRARIDLTQDGTYSLSTTTHKILAGLDEPLLIRGYFSSKTHPLLAPLVPQIKDMLEEYKIAGGDKVRVEIVDPTTDDQKRDAKDQFGIDPTPLRFATSAEKSVINAYFAIAIQYGDQHIVLKLDDLIHVSVVDVGNVEVTLGNLEYQLTKAIKKAQSEFSSVDTLFASTPGKIKLTAYLTPDTLPDNWKDAEKDLKGAVDALQKQANGKLEFTEVTPKGDDQMKDLYQRFGLRPYQDILTGKVYYFNLLLQVGDRMVRIVPPEQDLSVNALKATLTEGLKRAAPGFTRVVGLWQPPAPAPTPAMQGMPPQRRPPPQTFDALRHSLQGNYEVRDTSLAAPLPDDMDVLVLAGPANLTPAEAKNLDQFVMRGGALVALDGHYRIAPGSGLNVEKVTTGLAGELKAWGISVGDDMVLDKKSDSFPIPEDRDVGNGMVVRELHQLAYPYFVKMTGDELSSDSLITSGLTTAVMHWASPVKADAKVGADTHRIAKLLTSSDDSWLSPSTKVEPDLQNFPGVGFPGPKDLPSDKKGAQVLAVAVSGEFTSAVAKDAKNAKQDAAAAKQDAGLIAHSPPDTRVIVFGSSAFVSDDILQLAQQLAPEVAASNLELVHNAVDWALADTDLLAIRGHDAAARALTVPPASRSAWRTANLLIAAALLVLVVGFAYLRRRSVRPIL
jgi:ABC-2 type transport system permease protein